MSSMQRNRDEGSGATEDTDRDHPVGFNILIPYPPKPKARPRVTTRPDGTSHTYMPQTYAEWKENVGTIIRLKGKNLQGNVEMQCVFYPDHIRLWMMETPKGRHGRADLDNLLGGVMDAAQMSGVIENDKNVVYVEGFFREEG